MTLKTAQQQQHEIKPTPQHIMIGAGFFIFACVVLGAMILIGNSLVFWYNFRNSIQDKFSIMKASLSVADSLAGIQIFGVVLYNVSWTINSTSQELDMKQLLYQDSPQAIIGGMFYIMSFTSSLFHLLYFSGQRLFAVTYPINYKIQSNAHVAFGLVLTWILGVISATVPAWFPNTYTYSYYHTIYLFLPSIRNYSSTNNSSSGAALALVFVFSILPYCLMVILTITSALQIRIRLIRSASLSKSMDKDLLKKKEVKLIKTVAIMQIGFTVTLVPVVVILVLFYAHVFSCKNVSTPYVIGFYMSMSNSLVNVLVYSGRDSKFRAWLKSIVTCKSVPAKEDSHTSFSATRNHNAKATTETDNAIQTSKIVSR
uniref:relaxin receptor 2 isoform X2 n=1 Tax=Ciona intestinalis TaxID=7719 RepID=UPI000EF53C8A|nr:relaxin receptor 2 isoform X2 [Ciona intestinalis]|eukprot:XP_026690068.1 relaxin receptor 2 isoform X2 [Ciona intestinalis]